MRSATAKLAVIVAAFIVIVAPASVDAAPGDLDPTFGVGGKVTTDFASGSDRARGVAVQPDGKVIAVGLAGVPGGGAFGIVRYDLDGSLDSTFGTGGKVTGHFGTFAEAAAVAVQPDGRIVVGGSREFGEIVVVRLRADGTPDRTFGASGAVVVGRAFGKSEQLAGLALQPDGKIIVVGNQSPPQIFLVARLNANGSLDTSFGQGGKVTTPFGAFALARAVAIQPDGKIVTAGTQGPPTNTFALARYHMDGSLDQSFGDGGKVTTIFTPSAGAGGVAVDLLGRIVAAGSAGGNRIALARYDSGGRLDATFGDGGQVTSAGGPIASALVLEPDGRIVVAGTAIFGASGDRDFALARYDAAGRPDTTFGSMGLVTTDFGGLNDSAAAVAKAPDGKLLLAGTTSAGDFGVARYSGSGDTTPPVITPQITGELGQSGWYTSDVVVAWSVVDAESAISAQSGCHETTVSADTPGTTLTCTATSEGGTSSATVTIRRDATPPTLACSATPSVLWPPNQELRAIETTVDARDDVSGIDGIRFDTAGANEGDPASDIVDWTPGTFDTVGSVRAERFGSGSGRLYTLTYRGSDFAGNTAVCDATVRVPHDSSG